MNIINADVIIMDDLDGQAILKKIEQCGRVCYKSEDKITRDSAEEFVRKIMKSGHDAVLEHVNITVKFITDRGVSHEIVRHRLASYCQESTRYCDYSGGHITYILPCWLNDYIKPGVYQEYIATPLQAANDWLNAMWNIEDIYKDLRKAGWSPQEARSVLPNSLKTEVVMTANIREWRHFLKLRTSAAAHPQMREVAIKLIHKLQHEVPVLFGDIQCAD